MAWAEKTKMNVKNASRFKSHDTGNARSVDRNTIVYAQLYIVTRLHNQCFVLETQYCAATRLFLEGIL